MRWKATISRLTAASGTGTTLAVWVLYIVAAADAHRQSLSTALLAYVASLAVNVYIVGTATTAINISVIS